MAYLAHSYRVIHTAPYTYLFQSTWLNIFSWSTKIAKMAELWGRWRRISSNKKPDRSPSRGSHTSQIYSWKSLFFLLSFALNKRITFHNTMTVTQQYVTRASIIPFVIAKVRLSTMVTEHFQWQHDRGRKTHNRRWTERKWEYHGDRSGIQR